jgi:hypothetical protein
MKTTTTLVLRRFPVVVRDNRTGNVLRDTVVLDKDTLNAAQLVGQSSKELIYRMYNRNGAKVLEIGKPERANVTVILDEVFRTLIPEDFDRG